MSASQLVALAGNLRAVWTAPSTDARLKKRIVRTLIHEVVADLDDVASEIVLVIHLGWWGPHRATLAKTAPRATKRDT